jgi:hypothetical protein
MRVAGRGGALLSSSFLLRHRAVARQSLAPVLRRRRAGAGQSALSYTRELCHKMPIFAL